MSFSQNFMFLRIKTWLLFCIATFFVVSGSNTVATTIASSHVEKEIISTPDQNGCNGIERYFDPVAGRFISPDPGRFTDSRNLYALCGHNPITGRDPDGRLMAGAGRGALMGDYAQYGNTAQAIGGFVGQVGAGITPAGWVGDVRDFMASVSDLAKKGLGWSTGLRLGMSAVAFVPGAGDAIKGMLNPLLRAADDVPVNNVVKAVEESSEVTKNAGRTGKQARLRELTDDPNVSSADRGWIQQEMNSVERGQRDTIRNPPGKDLAHARGREAAKGYSYEQSNLQDRDLHKIQHKFDDFGRANKERPLRSDKL